MLVLQVTLLTRVPCVLKGDGRDCMLYNSIAIPITLIMDVSGSVLMFIKPCATDAEGVSRFDSEV
jgi:hypothetical protein